MKQIAVAIMVVGLCFYQAYKGETDSVASSIAFIGAVWLLLS